MRTKTGIEPDSPTGRSEAARTSEDWHPLSGPSILLMLGTVLFVGSWGKWPDPTVDFGRELYVAWRLSEGSVLYRDVAWMNGPLSPYLNALLFKIFGTHLVTLVLANGAILACAVAVVYRLLRALTSRRVATVAMGVFLPVFGFSQMLTTANYNFICPYSHEITHGFLLACLAVYLFHEALVSERPAAAAAGGVAVGLAFLTKPETAVAACAAAFTYIVLGWVPARQQSRWWARRAIPAILAGAVAPPVLAVALLGFTSSHGQALHDVLTPWRVALDERVWRLPFYRMSSGLDSPVTHFWTLLAWAGVYVGVATTVLGAAFAFRNRRTAAAWSVPLAFVVAGLLVFLAPHIAWQESAAAMPLVAAVAAGAGLAATLRGPHRETGVLLTALGMLSLALLAKIPLASRTHHYGFVLAAPATLLFVAFLLDHLPALAARRGRSPEVVFALASSVLAVWVLHHVAVTRAAFASKHTVVASGADRFLADSRGEVVQQAAEWMRRQAPEGASLVVLPEGAMLNYIARRPSPVPYVTFMPPEVLAFTEARMLQALQASPPTIVVLLHKDTTEYGYPLFGRDYGHGIMGWVRGNYRRALLLGDEPLRDPKMFGAEILVGRRSQGRPWAEPGEPGHRPK